jgi:ferredoxin-thioredoxin reductase catalytic subunit
MIIPCAYNDSLKAATRSASMFISPGDGSVDDGGSRGGRECACRYVADDEDESINGIY